jgi:hemolysin activation/secretion protein
LFIDYGYVSDKNEDIYDKEYNSASASMAGCGITLGYSGKYLMMTLTYARGLHSPDYLQTRDGLKKEKEALYWRIGANW